MTNRIISVPNFRLLFNGKEPTVDLRAAVEGITIEEELNLPTMFTIRLNTVVFKTGDWRGIDLETFTPGDVVQVFMGMDQTTVMMIGEIAALELVFGEDSYLDIRGYDRLHRLQFGTLRRSFKEMKDSEIVSSIAAGAGLKSQVEDTGIIVPYLFQNNQSNYDFLLERARRIGYELLADDQTIIFRKSRENKKAELTLRYGIDLDSFAVDLQTLTPGNSVTVRGWDVKDKKEICATAGAGSETTLMGGRKSGGQLSQAAFGESLAVIPDEVVADTGDAERLATAKYNRILREFISGEGRCAGNPQLRAGKTVAIQGLGARFSGNYYLVSTSHSLKADQGYTTTFKVKRTGI